MPSNQEQELKDKARKLHFNSIVVDTHADTISRMVDPKNNTHGIHDDPDRARDHFPIEDQGVDISKRLEDGHLDYPEYLKADLVCSGGHVLYIQDILPKKKL